MRREQLDWEDRLWAASPIAYVAIVGALFIAIVLAVLSGVVILGELVA